MEALWHINEHNLFLFLLVTPNECCIGVALKDYSVQNLSETQDSAGALRFGVLGANSEAGQWDCLEDQMTLLKELCLNV